MLLFIKFLYTCVIMAAFILLLRFISALCKEHDDMICPKCGKPLRFYIRDEQDPKSNLHIVDYWCTNCNYKVTLPPDEK